MIDNIFIYSLIVINILIKHDTTKLITENRFFNFYFLTIFFLSYY